MAASMEADCPLAYLVFDLRGHNEKTKKRLKSAADFVLKYAFDNPRTYPMTVSAFPIPYMVLGKANLASFMAAKLFALNMVYLEDAITMHCSVGDILQMNDQDLNSIIEAVLQLKEHRNKEDKESTYPKGTGMASEILWAVMETKFHAPKNDDSSSDLCQICKEELASTTVFILPYCQHEFHTRCLERRVCEEPEDTHCPICQNWALPLQAEYPNWIKDTVKVREFLTRNSRASISVFHALMAMHLEELELEDVLNSFRRQIHTIMNREKQTRRDELDMIRREVVAFLKGCRDPKEGLVLRFHSLMLMMVRALCLDHVYQDEFKKTMREANVDQLKNCDSIRKLSRFLQAVEYVQGNGV